MEECTSYIHILFLRYLKKKFLLVFILLRSELQGSNIYNFSQQERKREGTRASLIAGKNVKKKTGGGQGRSSCFRVSFANV